MNTQLRILPRASLAALLLIMVLLLAGCNRPHDFNGTAYDPVIPAPELRGTNADGTPFDLADLRGQVVMLFFGYTSCPDICPLALSDMKQVEAQLGDKAANTAVVFVSLDPERDTPERLRAYMEAFDPTFIGVSVPQEQLEQITKDFGAYSAKVVVDPNASAAGYLIEHTGWTYVIDKQGNLRVLFATDTPIADRVEDVGYLVGRS
jgi:protein SCO1/2